jgi:hypothetical protein
MRYRFGMAERRSSALASPLPIGGAWASALRGIVLGHRFRLCFNHLSFMFANTWHLLVVGLPVLRAPDK